MIIRLTSDVEASIVADLRQVRLHHEESLTQGRYRQDAFDIAFHGDKIAAIDAVLRQLHLRPSNEGTFVQLCWCCRQPLPAIPVPADGDAWDVCDRCLSLRSQCQHRKFGYEDPIFIHPHVRCRLCGILYEPPQP